MFHKVKMLLHEATFWSGPNHSQRCWIDSSDLLVEEKYHDLFIMHHTKIKSQNFYLLQLVVLHGRNPLTKRYREQLATKKSGNGKGKRVKQITKVKIRVDPNLFIEEIDTKLFSKSWHELNDSYSHSPLSSGKIKQFETKIKMAVAKIKIVSPAYLQPVLPVKVVGIAITNQSQ